MTSTHGCAGDENYGAANHKLLRLGPLTITTLFFLPNLTHNEACTLKIKVYENLELNGPERMRLHDVPDAPRPFSLLARNIFMLDAFSESHRVTMNATHDVICRRLITKLC